MLLSHTDPSMPKRRRQETKLSPPAGGLILSSDSEDSSQEEGAAPPAPTCFVCTQDAWDALPVCQSCPGAVRCSRCTLQLLAKQSAGVKIHDTQLKCPLCRSSAVVMDPQDVWNVSQDHQRHNRFAMEGGLGHVLLQQRRMLVPSMSLTCISCPEQFDTLQAWHCHMKTCEGWRTYCACCGHHFHDTINFQAHRAASCPYGYIRCVECAQPHHGEDRTSKAQRCRWRCLIRKDPEAVIDVLEQHGPPTALEQFAASFSA